MSWFSELADKAEDFLNKIDQGAADALLIEEGTKTNHAVIEIPQQQGQIQPQNLINSVSVPQNINSYHNSSVASNSKRTITPPSKATAKSVVKQNQDDHLLAFLNSSDTLPTPKKSGQVSTGPNTATHSRQSSLSSVSSIGNLFGLFPDGTVKVEDGTTDEERRTSTNGVADAETESEVKTGVEMAEKRENELLRNEVQSLNQEMAQVLQRVKDAQREVTVYKEKLTKKDQSLTASDRVVRDLQQRHSDLQETLKVKDTQLAVLKVRLHEVDEELLVKKENIDKLQSENQRILRDSSDSSGLHSQALQSLQFRLADTEAELQRDKETNRRNDDEHATRVNHLEESQKYLTASLRDIERRLAEERRRHGEVSQHLQASKAAADGVRQELAQYKAKAQRILLSKDKLIASLREPVEETSGEDHVLQEELDQIRQERDLLREEVQAAQADIQRLTTELQDMESQAAAEADTVAENLRHLEESLEEEKGRRDESEKDARQLQEEVRYMRDELTRQKTMMTSQVRDREAEVEKLRNQLTAKQIATTTEAELETRLRALTENLIQKQTNIESLSSEKNSLLLQLERQESLVKEADTFTVRSRSLAVGMNDTDDDLIAAKSRMPGFLEEGPFDSSVARRVKRVYSGLDTFSVRLGIFLRRYPIARVFVIAYMFLLHTWVMIVLLTYTPEIHDTNYDPEKKMAFVPEPPKT